MEKKILFRIVYRYEGSVKNFSVTIESKNKESATIEFWRIIKESFGVPNGIRIIYTAKKIPYKEFRLLRRNRCYT